MASLAYFSVEDEIFLTVTGMGQPWLNNVDVQLTEAALMLKSYRATASTTSGIFVTL